MMSAGSRSGVNWIRWKRVRMVRALQQDVPARQQTDQHLPQELLLAHDHAADLAHKPVKPLMVMPHKLSNLLHFRVSGHHPQVLSWFARTRAPGPYAAGGAARFLREH
jgi:hypothetical protein